jgi:hypothetical protein
VSVNTGLQWLGQRVRVFWKDDFMWYNGCIDDHYGGDRYHIVYDDDGFEEWISLPSVSSLEKSRVVLCVSPSVYARVRLLSWDGVASVCLCVPFSPTSLDDPRSHCAKCLSN